MEVDGRNTAHANPSEGDAQVLVQQAVEVAFQQEAVHLAPVYGIVDDDGIDVSDTTSDPIAQMLVDAAHQMNHTERSGNRETEVDVSASLAALVDSRSPACEYKPRLFLALDLRSQNDASRHRLAARRRRAVC